MYLFFVREKVMSQPEIVLNFWGVGISKGVDILDSFYCVILIDVGYNKFIDDLRIGAVKAHII